MFPSFLLRQGQPHSLWAIESNRGFQEKNRCDFSRSHGGRGDESANWPHRIRPNTRP